MAFFNKVGNILKQTACKHVNIGSSMSCPSLYQAIRCMSSSKLFIGGLSYNTDEPSLQETFSKYGEVVEAKIIFDRETGRSRGFGFVTYTSAEEASSAIQALDGQDLHGRQVRVNYAMDRPRGFGGGGYSGGSGYGGGGDYAGGGGGYTGGGGYSGSSGGYTGGGGDASYGGGNYGNVNVSGDGYGGNLGGGDSNAGEFGSNEGGGGAGASMGSADLGGESPSGGTHEEGAEQPEDYADRRA